MNEKLFPAVLIALQLAAAVACFFHRDIRHGVYWAAAAVVNAAVTF